MRPIEFGNSIQHAYANLVQRTTIEDALQGAADTMFVSRTEPLTLTRFEEILLMITSPSDAVATVSHYRFEVIYERLKRDATIDTAPVYGTTIVTAQRHNLGLPGATERLKSRFHRSRSVKALSIRPYLSGSDLGRQRRQNTRGGKQGA